MVNKNHYFVTVDTQDIREMSIPDGGIEFEIIASYREIEEIRELFMKRKKVEKNALEYLSKPFNEWGADDERNRYDNHLMALYHKIYELGTAETKSKVKEIGIFN